MFRPHNHFSVAPNHIVHSLLNVSSTIFQLKYIFFSGERFSFSPLEGSNFEPADKETRLGCCTDERRPLNLRINHRINITYGKGCSHYAFVYTFAFAFESELKLC